MGNYKIFFFFFVLAIFLFLPKEVLAENLLQNPGFEEGINSWSFKPQTATFSATQSPTHGGNYAALLTKIDFPSWSYFSQKVNIEADKYYKLSGWVILNDSFINNIKLRFYWLDSSEAKISSTVEIETKTNDSAFQFLETESSLSPSNAYFAEIQGYVYLDTANPVNPAIFDDFTFEETEPPSSPEPAEEPGPTEAPTPTPIPTSTPTPTKKPTPTLKPSPTSTPTGEILGEEESATNAFYPLATEEAESTSQSGSSFKTRWLPKILLGVGFLLLFGAAFWVWYTKLRWPEQESS